MNKRVVLIVLDSVGIGSCPDSCLFGDEGCNTLQHTAAAVGGLKLPNLQRMGLGNIEHIKGVPPQVLPAGAYGKMQEQSKGKDTTSGHWEMMGLIMDRPFPTYPQGFPPGLITEFERRIGRKTLGNKVASGTVIIQELGDEHMATGWPIVYTSADSVFQIAAHEEVVPLEELYGMCRTARALLQGEHGVGRVIARPFVGKTGDYRRTPHRHDFSLPPGKNALDYIIESGQQVIGVGKISDIFAGRGLTESFAIGSNQEGVEQVLKIMETDFSGLIFANLVDFDQLYGHRNDAAGYARALEEFDVRLPEIIALLGPGDLLAISADHGCDPTTSGTDHTREYVPLLLSGPGCRPGVNLGIRSSFADVGATVADHLGVRTENLAGESFLDLIRK